MQDTAIEKQGERDTATSRTEPLVGPPSHDHHGHGMLAHAGKDLARSFGCCLQDDED